MDAPDPTCHPDAIAASALRARSTPAGRPVLVAVHDPDAGPLVARYFAAADYRIATVRSGAEAIERLGEVRFDLLVADTELADIDAAEIVRRLRLPRSRTTSGMLNHGVPVVVLGTGEDASSQASDALLQTLAAGADAVMPWPVSPEELLLKVGAILGRVRSGLLTREPTFTIGPLAVRLPAHDVRVDGHAVALTPTEFAILITLADVHGVAITRTQLRHVLGRSGSSASDRALDVQVGRLRGKLGVAAPLIETVRGVGYRLRRA